MLFIVTIAGNMGNFIENNWTRWADEHNLDIHIRAMPHRKKLGRRVGGAYIFKEQENKRLFFRNPWTGWEKFDPFTSTIENYRKHNLRPFWAKTFSEQGKEGKHEVLEPAGQTKQGCKIHSFEEELITFGGKNTKVIRFLDGSGRCRQVNIIHILEDKDYYSFRQENWVSKGKWQVTHWGWIAYDQIKPVRNLLSVAQPC
jgi:hypothetical protein